MTVKLLAIDVDDTLITDELVIPKETHQAISQAQAKGVHVILATGRMWQSTVPYARELGLTGPLILYNGAMVRTVEGEVKQHYPVPLSLARELAKLCQAHDLDLNVYVDDELYVEQVTEHTEYYQMMTGTEAVPVGDLVHFLDTEPTKLLIVGHEAPIASWLGHLSQQYEGQLSIFQSKPRYIEITRKGISKGVALKALAESLGLAREEVIAIGDGGNDVAMLQYAGIGVAVGNASDAAKEAADWIAPSNEEAGVAEAIRKFIL